MEAIDRATEAVETTEDGLQDRLAALLEAEETENEPTEPEGQSEDAEESESEETASEEDSQEEDAEPVYMDLRWGDEVKKVTADEYRNFAEAGFNATQKTQLAAEKERALQAKEQFLQEREALQEALGGKLAELKAMDSNLAQWKQVNWQQLAQEDPTQYLIYNQQYQQAKDARAELANEIGMEANKAKQSFSDYKKKVQESEVKMLLDVVPELRGEKGKQAVGDLQAFLQSRGLDNVEITDHRILRIAYEAAQFNKLKTAQPAIKKKMAEAPKVIKNKQPAPNSEVKQLRERARRGDESAVLALIERSL